MRGAARHDFVVRARRQRAGLPWRTWRVVPIHIYRQFERRGTLASLQSVLAHRRSVRACSVIFRIPRSHGLPHMAQWPLSRWQALQEQANDRRAAVRICARRGGEP